MADSPPYPSQELRKQALHWLVRQHSGRFSRSDQTALDLWLAEAPANRQVFEALNASWRSLPQPGAAVRDARRYQPPRYAARRGYYWQPILAACLLLALGTGYREGWPLSVESVQRTAKGEHRSWELPDGSLLELNTATEVAVRYGWHSRTVEIRQGEALFSVAPGKLRPFRVLAAGATIRDIGTRFDVDLRPPETRVTVLEGAVDVRLAGGSGEQRRAAAGQSLAYEPARIVSEPTGADLEAISAWREGKLVFRAKPLRAALEEFSRYHDLTFRISDTELAHWPISGVFASRELKAFLATLEEILPVHIRRGFNNEVLVVRRKSV
jgi:transmembrane sensor